ncbi:MAG: hypothetical protein CMO81_12115 [Waddliaceae bacterium]|nr:hypothetical protein [Waddliaceae bacterium]
MKSQDRLYALYALFEEIKTMNVRTTIIANDLTQYANRYLKTIERGVHSNLLKKIRWEHLLPMIGIDWTPNSNTTTSTQWAYYQYTMKNDPKYGKITLTIERTPQSYDEEVHINITMTSTSSKNPIEVADIINYLSERVIIDQFIGIWDTNSKSYNIECMDSANLFKSLSDEKWINHKNTCNLL